LDRWEPRIEVLKLDAGPVEGAMERLTIQLEYRVKSSQHLGRAAFDLSLAGD
jgi:phage baseplate assembly protein W